MSKDPQYTPVLYNRFIAPSVRALYVELLETNMPAAAEDVFDLAEQFGDALGNINASLVCSLPLPLKLQH